MIVYNCFSIVRAFLKQHRWMILLLAFGSLLRVMTWRGICISDPGTYTTLAHQLSEGQLQLGHAASVRLGVYAPVAWVIRWLGVTDLSVGIIPFLASLGTILLTYLLGRRFGNEATGRWSGLIVAVLPVEIAHGTCLFPEAMLTFWTLLAITLLTSAVHPRPTVNTGLALGAGLAGGMAYMTKVSGLIVVPLLLGWLLATPGYRRRIAPFIASCAMVIATEMLIFFDWTGNYLFSWQAVSMQQASMLQASAAERAYQSLWIYPRDLLLDPQFAFLLLAWLLGFPLWFRRHARLFPMAWLIVFFLFLQFGSSSWRSYIPVPHLARYLSLIVAPLAICTAQAWAGPRSGRPPRWHWQLLTALATMALLAGLLYRFSHGILPALTNRAVHVSAACACLLALAAAIARANHQLLRTTPLLFVMLFGSLTAISDARAQRKADNIRHAFVFFKESPPIGPIYTDQRTLSGLRMFWNFRPPVALHEFPLNELSGPLPTGSHLVINWDQIMFSRKTYKTAFPDYLRTVNWPAEWEEQYRRAPLGNARSLVILRVTSPVEPM